MLKTLWCFALGATLALALPAAAQDDASRDAEARSVFDAGQTAFNNARYDDALEYFRRAYELSGRSVLLYNVGVAADRLRRDEEALAAFEQFLAEVPEHPRRRDVEVRVGVLREAIARGSAAAPASGAAPVGSEAAAASETPAAGGSTGGGGGPDALGIAGSVTLGVLGLAGITAAVVGLAGGSGCLERAGDTCIEERQPGWVGVGVWGGLGVAALAAGVIWLVVSLDGGDGDDAAAWLDETGAIRWAL